MRNPEELALALLRPRIDRERVAVVRQHLREGTSVADAIAICSEQRWLPAAWFADPTRGAGTVCAICLGSGEEEAIDQGVSLGMWPCQRCSGSCLREGTWTLALLTALASDATIVAAVERLGVEAARRLGPEGGPISIWWGALARVADFDWMQSRGEPTWLTQHAWYAWFLQLSPAAASLRAAVLAAPRPGRAHHAAAAAADHAAFELEWTHRARAGQLPFAAPERQNPFTPLVDLWLTGYAVDGIARSTVCLAIADRPRDD